MAYAHRVFYFLFKEVLPDDRVVRHNCPGGDNPLCVNPLHLMAGTVKENTYDSIRKGRGRLGAANVGWKLDPVAVRMIRSRAGSESLPSIASSLNINFSTVWRVVNGRSWTAVV